MADKGTLQARIEAAKSASPSITSTTPVSSSTSADPTAADSGSAAVEPIADDSGAADDPLAQDASNAEPSSTADDSPKTIDDDSPKSVDELKKSFARLSKREKKLRKEKQEMTDASKKKEAEFSRAREELVSESNRVSQLLRHAQDKYAWIPKAEQAWDNDDRVGFSKAIQKLAKGASIASITQWLAGASERPASQSTAPSEEEQQWRREKAEWERQRSAEKAKRETEEKSKSSAVGREQGKKRLATAFASHPFLRDPDDPKSVDSDALDEAIDVVARAVKNRQSGETPNQAAKRALDGLHQRDLKKLKRLGIKLPEKQNGSAQGKDKNGAPPKKGERLPEPPANKHSPEKSSLADTRASRLALAKRLSEQQRRGVLR